MQTLGAERVSTIAPYYQRPLAIALTFGACFLIALPLVLARMSPNDSVVLPYLILAEAVGLGTTHFFLTLAVYLQPSQLQYANSSWARRFTYFALPVLILLLFAWVEAWPLKALAPAGATYFYLVVRFADFFHVGRQSVGVLQIWKTPLKEVLPSWTRQAENALFVGLALLQLETYAFGGTFPADRMSAWLPALLLAGLFLMIVVQYLALLLAVDTVSPVTTLDGTGPVLAEVTRISSPPELRKSGSNGVRPPALRLSNHDEPTRESLPNGIPTPRVTTRPAEPSEPRIPRSVPKVSARPEPRASSKSPVESRGAAAAAAVLLVLAAVGLTWSLTRPEPQETQTAAISAQVEPTPTPVLRLCGSNTVGAELAPALAEALFASKDSSAKVAHKRNIDSDVTQLVSKSDDKALSAEITARGTATAFTGLAEGRCDVGMASRAIDAAETQRLKDKGLGDLSSAANEHVIALDGVAVVVHPNNPLTSLDRVALHAIFTGKVTNWSEIGGSAGPIHVMARDDQSGTYDTFHHLVLGQDKLIATAKRYVRSDALADAVASDPAAVGFVGLAYVRTAKALAVGEAGAAPLLPTQFTVATEGYMLSRRLYFYTPDKPSSPWVTELVNFAMSPRGQEIAAKAGFVSLSLLTESVRCDGNCPARYRDATTKAQRVSVDVRFRTGSNTPDSRARRDMDRLVTFLQNFREAKVLLLGFSDGMGSVTANQKLSVERAKTVADELARRGIHASLVTGFGPEMPVATNDTEVGRQRNRRVEVWFEHL